MSSLAQSIEIELLKQRGHDDTLSLWREIWKKYEHEGLDAVSGYLNELLAVQEEDQ
jgi:hypothetical protein